MNYVATKMLSRLHAIRGSEQGATAVEYALMVALIAIAIIGAVSFLGTEIGNAFQKSGNSLTPTKAP